MNASASEAALQPPESRAASRPESGAPASSTANPPSGSARWSPRSARCSNARTRASGSLARDWQALTVASATGGCLLGIDMTHPEVASIFGLLDKWRNLPPYRIERRADIFFALLLPDVLNRHLSAPGIAIDPRVIPEFPLKRHKGLVVQTTTFAMVFLLAGFAGSFPWLALGSCIRRVLRNSGHARAFNIVMADLLVMTMIPAVLTEVVV